MKFMRSGKDQPGTPLSAHPDRPSPGPALLLLLAAWLASSWGLLDTPLDFYDEPLLLLGGRLMRAGRLPYRDFYTNYGPLGYEVISRLPQPGNAGIGYRLAVDV